MIPPVAATGVEVTGVRESPSGETTLVEVEVRDGTGEVRLVQTANDSRIHGVLFGGFPAVLVDPAGAVALNLRAGKAVTSEGANKKPEHVDALPAVEAWEKFSEPAILAVAAALLNRLSDGLYSVTERSLPAPAGGGEEPCASPRVFDPGPIAADDGAPVCLDLASGFHVLLGGRHALLRGEKALSISGEFLLEGEGVRTRRHDLGARESFARSCRHLIDDRVLRDAVVAHQQDFPRANLGLFAPDRLEPARLLASALLAELEQELNAQARPRPVGPTVRLVENGEVAFITSVGAASVIVVTHDGQTLTEARVRAAGGWETGLRPSARALARALHKLCPDDAWSQCDDLDEGRGPKS